MADLASFNAIPQGFSVYQPAPGAQLEFLPAMGTQQLDDLINTFIPGPASIQEKRAAVSIDFLKYTQTTGASFKFYQVCLPVASPAMTESLSFSSYASPATPSWDFGKLPASTPPAASSRSSRPSQSRQNSVASSSVSRHQTADFAHLPGMKILTRDGTDITNSAFRNVKTKEQRDHAHLMRIIKACESCRKRKTRCDPSHRKSGGAATQTKAQAPAKVVKRTTKATQATAPKPQSVAQPSIFNDDFTVDLTQSTVDMSFADNLDDFSMADLSESAWDQLLAQPLHFADDFQLQTHAFSPSDFSLSPQSLSLSTTANSSSSTSPSSLTPASSSDSASQQPQTPVLPYVGQSESGILNDYVDFSLYSPQSSFSEDELMLPLKKTSAPISSSSSASSSSSSIQPSGDSSGLPQATSQAANGTLESLADAFNLDNFVFATAAPATAVAGGLAQANESSVLPYTTELAPDRYDPGSGQLAREDAGGFLQGDWHTDGPVHPNRLPSHNVPGVDGAHNNDLLARTRQGETAIGAFGTSRGPSNADLIRAYEAMVSSIGFHDGPAGDVATTQATGAQPFAERTQRIARPLPTVIADSELHSQVANATLLPAVDDSTNVSPTTATVTLPEAKAKIGTTRPTASSDDLHASRQGRLCLTAPAKIGSDGDLQSSPSPSDESNKSAVATSSPMDATRTIAAFAGMVAVANGETARLQTLLTVMAMAVVLFGMSLVASKVLRSATSTTSASTVKTYGGRFAHSHRRLLAARHSLPSMTSRLAICSLG